MASICSLKSPPHVTVFNIPSWFIYHIPTHSSAFCLHYYLLVVVYSLHSQCTVSTAEATRLPTTLSTSHVYSPSSWTVTGSRRRLRSCSTVTRPSGMLPPPAERRHSTSGAGSPPTTQLNVTLLPTCAVTSSGPWIRNGFTANTREAFVHVSMRRRSCFLL